MVSRRRYTSNSVVTAVALAVLPVAGSIFHCTTASAQSHPQPKSSRKIAIDFEPNRGQGPTEALYVAHSAQGELYLTQDGFKMAFQGEGKLHMLSTHLRGMNLSSKASGEAIAAGVANYYSGSDPKAWIQNLPLYERVRYRAVYSGTDLIFHTDGGHLEYDFELAPGADPRQISMDFTGADWVDLDPVGNLLIHAGGRTLQLRAPSAYQSINRKRVDVSASYHLVDDHVVFALGNYNRAEKLTIDPVVSYASFIDLGATDASLQVQSVAVDASGNLFVSGKNVFQVYLTKVDPTGATIFSNYISGASEGSGGGGLLRTDPQGNVYLTGVATADSFPLTSTSLGTCSGFCNAGFVSKFDNTGSLVYSTMLSSGINTTIPTSIVVDAKGSVYITGLTEGGLQTVNAYQPAYTNYCSFFAKLNSSGTGYEFASYLGSDTVGQAIALDQTGNLYVAGSYGGGAIPLRGELQSQNGFYLTKFTPDGKTLLFGTLLGGGGETVAGLAVGPDNTVYLAGETDSYSLPYTVEAYRHPLGPTSFGRYMFAMAINPSLSGLTYSTFLGTGVISGVALNSKGDLFMAGATQGDVPPNGSAVVSDVQPSNFLLELDPSGKLVVSTPFGGRGTAEIPTSVALDSSNNIYLAGTFPVPPAGHNPTCMNPDPLTVGAPAYALESGFHNCELNSPGKDVGGFVAQISPANKSQISLSSVLPNVVLRNAGSADLHISNITVGGSLAKVAGNCGTIVPAGSSCVLTLTDSKGLEASGSVTITSDAEPNVQTFTPQITKDGIGSEIYNADFLWVDTSHIVFAAQQIGVPSAPQPFTVSNAGLAATQALAITGVANLSATSNCPASLAAGASCTGQVVWTPLANYATTNTITISGTHDSVQFTPAGSFIANSGPLLTSVPDGKIIVYGTQTIGNPALYRTVTVMNVGALTISAPTAMVTGSAEFSLAGNTCISELAPQQSCVVAVIFQPVLPGGHRLGTLTISGGGSLAAITLSGTGQTGTSPPNATVASSVALGSISLGSSGTQSLTIANSGGGSLSLAQFMLQGANASDFSVVPGQCATVALATNCSVTINFTPSASGNRTATLMITDNAINTPQLVTLNGVGTAPSASLSLASLNFGAQDQNIASPAQVMTLTNSGNANLAIASIAITGDFSQINTCGSSVAVGGSCSITVIFKPTQIAASTGALSITDNAVNSPQIVALSGTGTLPGITLGVAPGGSASATMTVSRTTTYDLSVVASTGFNGTVAFTCQGAPANTSCSITPSSVSLQMGGNANFAVSVATNPTQASIPRPSDISRTEIGAFGVFTLPLLLGLRRRSKTGPLASSKMLLLAFLGAVAMGLSGCGTSGGQSGATSVVPSGTYFITVTAKGNTATASEKLTLTVQ